VHAFVVFIPLLHIQDLEVIVKLDS